MNQSLSNIREVKISSLSSSFNLLFDSSTIDIQVHLDFKSFDRYTMSIVKYRNRIISKLYLFENSLDSLDHTPSVYVLKNLNILKSHPNKNALLKFTNGIKSFLKGINLECKRCLMNKKLLL